MCRVIKRKSCRQSFFDILHNIFHAIIALFTRSIIHLPFNALCHATMIFMENDDFGQLKVLPTECILTILSYLDKRDLASCQQVNKVKIWNLTDLPT